MKYRLGTRRSALAKIQSEWVKSQLSQRGVDCELVEIESEGDLNLKKPLYEIETNQPGLFTKQLEQALIQNEIDLAVHSLKDLPTLQPPELKVAAITERVGVGDTLVILESRFDPNAKFGLPKGAKVGTSSLRREAELLESRPDCTVKPLRGNLPTRIEAVRQGKLDAVILATAGLERLGVASDGLRRQLLTLDAFIPAPGQGALAIEVRSDCSRPLGDALMGLHHAKTARECVIERKILRELEGGCTLPLGVLASATPNSLNIKAFLGVLDGASGPVHRWKSFERFDKSDASEQSVVAACIAYFQPWIRA